MSDSLQSFIESHVAEAKPRLTHIAELQWLVSTTGKPEYEAQFAKEMQALRLLMAEPERYQNLLALMAADSKGDTLTTRQALLLSNQLREHQISPDLIAKMTALEVAIQGAFVKFRATVNGHTVSDNDIKTILRESDDVALRKAAWEASKQIGAQVADDVRELARVRNQAARQAGFADYYTMRLELDELNEAELFTLLDQLKVGSDPAWRAYKGMLDAHLAERFKVKPEELRPWHYGDPFFQEGQPSDVNPNGTFSLDRYFADKNLEELTRNYFHAIGLEIDDILARSDLYEREGKEQHAFCTDIDRQGDIRVLSNNRPDKYWADTMLHEFGHAVYDKYVDPTLPYLLRGPAHTLTTEAIAILSGNLVNEAAWLKRYAGVPQEEAEQLQAKLREAARTHALIFARWVFVMSHFERALYRDPEQDLNTTWWETVERFQWVRQPDQPSGSEWASKIHIGTAPVYYHNYLLGAMMSAQLRDSILNRVVNGSTAEYVSSPRVGAYLIERAFKPGATRDWRGWLQHATGHDLSAEAYIQFLSQAQG